MGSEICHIQENFVNIILLVVEARFPAKDRATFGDEEKMLGNKRIFVQLKYFSDRQDCFSGSYSGLTNTTYSSPSSSCRSPTCRLGIYGGLNGSTSFFSFGSAGSVWSAEGSAARSRVGSRGFF